MRYKQRMDRDQLLQYMLKQMEVEGIGKRKYAHKHGLNYPQLTQIFNGQRNPGPTFLKRIGIKRVLLQPSTYIYIEQE